MRLFDVMHLKKVKDLRVKQVFNLNFPEDELVIQMVGEELWLQMGLSLQEKLKGVKIKAEWA